MIHPPIRGASVATLSVPQGSFVRAAPAASVQADSWIRQPDSGEHDVCWMGRDGSTLGHGPECGVTRRSPGAVQVAFAAVLLCSVVAWLVWNGVLSRRRGEGTGW